MYAGTMGWRSYSTTVLFLAFLVVWGQASDDLGPFIYMDPVCPADLSGIPTLVLSTDVRARVTARCKNGPQLLTPDPGQNHTHTLYGAFQENHTGMNCLFFKKKRNTFVVDVEVVWRSRGSHAKPRRRIFKMACAFDTHGAFRMSSHSARKGYFNLEDAGNLKRNKSLVNQELQVVDVLDGAINPSHLAIGRKIRLRSTNIPGSVVHLRAVNCLASNGLKSYPILAEGCGDGLVIPRGEGFHRTGVDLISPEFEMFTLGGDDTVRFSCTVTDCDGVCGDNSCDPDSSRQLRSIKDEKNSRDAAELSRFLNRSVIIVASGTLKTDLPHPSIPDNWGVSQLTAQFEELHRPIFKQDLEQDPGHRTTDRVDPKAFAVLCLVAIVLAMLLFTTVYVCIAREEHRCGKV